MKPSVDKLNMLYPDRNHQDIKRLYGGVAGKKFWQGHPQQRNMYRTVYFRVNPFANNRIDPMFDNFVIGEPPAGVDELNPKLLQAVMRTRHLSDSPF